MSIVALIRDLVAKGLSWEDAAIFAERFEAGVEEAVSQRTKQRSSGAVRQARYRARHNDSDVTGDVTSDASQTLSQGSKQKVSPTPPSKTQPPNPILEPPIVPHEKPKKPRLKGDFESFWLAYPRKVGKGAAKRAYDRALARAGDEPGLTILDGLHRVRPFWADPEFIPHPTTWLGRDGWLDEPEPDACATGPPAFDLTKFEADRARMRAAYEAEEVGA